MKLWTGILALIAFVTAGFLWFLYAPVTPAYEGEREVRIPSGATFTNVVDSLEAARILEDEGRFRLLARLTGWGRQVKPGHYSFRSGASNYRVIDVLRKGLQTPVLVTIPPGTRPGVMAAILRRDLDIDSTSFRTTLRDSSLLEELGTDTTHLFGYMLPETMEFYWGSTAEQVVRRLKRASEAYFEGRLRERAEELGMSIEDVLTLASIVEWEARIDSERATIAGVYHNRIDLGMPLQADPTVQFAIMQQDGGRMRRLLYKDYRLKHPYNTYLYRGLPPGPINNPSKASIEAVLFPEDHRYLYFVANGDGSHTFSRTLREHNNAARRYRALMRHRRQAAE